MTEIIKEIYASVIEGDADTVKEKVQAALDAGTPAGAILNGALIAAMDEVGKRFEEGEFFVPEMLIAFDGTDHDLG